MSAIYRWRITTLLAVLLSLLGTWGALASDASASTTNATSVAVVVGDRQNSAPISGMNLEGLVGGWVAEGASVSIVVCDGLPALTASARLAATGPNELYLSRSAAIETSRGTRMLLGAKATAPEADTLGAITLAGRAVAEEAGARSVVVIDSGLDTVAPLAFQDGVLNDSPAQVVGFLRVTNKLPALGGTDVTWYGLGQVRNPQAPLTTAAVKKLTAIWTAVLKASGAEAVHMIETPFVGAHATPGLPPVTPVAVPPASTLTGETTPKLVIALSPQEVNFVPGQAAYLQPTEAGAVLATVAQEILSGHYTRVQVTGTAALPGWQPLSQARADAVEKSFLADGVPAAEITSTGVGEDFAGFVHDVSPSGALEPVQAEEDRLVIVTATR